MALKDDVWKYFAKFIDQNRKMGQAMDVPHFPPIGKEIEELISYLKANGVDPIIVGAFAVIKHLKMNEREFQSKDLRATQDLDVFVSSALPNPPPGWRRDRNSIGVISWISPSGGYVDFLMANHVFPDNRKNPDKIGKDSDSNELPVADLVSLFQLKLNSHREKDLLDLVQLARKIGIPKNIERHTLNSVQRENLELVKIWKESSTD